MRSDSDARPPATGRGATQEDDAQSTRRESIAAQLRASGCVFAEDEADILRETAGDDTGHLARLVRARADGAPLEPLVGWVEFAGRRLSVGPGVFVLGELRRPPGTRACTFVEAFAGVAPLAAVVSSELPGARVLACEQDPAALRHATVNLASRGAALPSDVLSGLPEADRGHVDVIAAVPPYVPDDDMGLLPREARDHEPASALSGGPDGLHWIRALIDEASGWIRPGGLLLIELSDHQLAAAAQHGNGRGWRQEPTEQDDDSHTTVLALRAEARSSEHQPG
jgi:release factor glutamine methyltransferase